MAHYSTLFGTTDSTRGGRRNAGLIDEIRDHDETEISEIVTPPYER